MPHVPDLPETVGAGETIGAGAVLAWEAADPPSVLLLLRAVGFEAEAAGAGRALAIAGLSLAVTGSSGPDRLRWAAEIGPRPRAGVAGTMGSPGPPDAADGVHLLAVAVAAVDLERAASAFGGPGRRLPEDGILGARVATTGAAGVLVAEPATEGRLAATLARHGEGPAALYVAVPPSALAELHARLALQGERPRHGTGPFGAQVLARSRPAWGPHLLLVPTVTAPGRPGGGRSATIAP